MIQVPSKIMMVSMFLTVCGLIIFEKTLMAESATEKGLRIVREAEEHDKGFKSYVADQIMVLRNRNGKESKRHLQISVLESENDGDKSLIVFKRPRDVKGTAMLTHAHKTKDDDQWLYLPALKRVKRISSANKSGPFMGSEFAYEDMVSQEIEKFNHRWLKDETCGNLICWVLEQIPINKTSGYSKQISWLDKSEYRLWQVKYFDRKETHLKTLTISNYQQYLDKHWRADEMLMVNHVTGKSTTLILQAYNFNANLEKHNFTQVSLKRAR